MPDCLVGVRPQIHPLVSHLQQNRRRMPVAGERLTAPLLGLSRGAPALGRRTRWYRRSTFHVLCVARGNLVIGHRYPDDWSRHPLGCDESPRASVAAGVEPSAVAESVIAPPIDEEVEVYARNV